MKKWMQDLYWCFDGFELQNKQVWWQFNNLKTTLFISVDKMTLTSNEMHTK